jgi:hypothetical protein
MTARGGARGTWRSVSFEDFAGVVVAQLRFCGRRLLCRCRVSFALLKSLTSRVHRNNVQPQAAAPPDGHRELHAQAIGGGAHLQQREADCALWRRRSPPLHSLEGRKPSKSD